MTTPFNFFSYTLPPERIAQRPLARGQSRLLTCAADGVCRDLQFSQIVELFQPGEVLVLNRSRVIPARFFTQIPESQKEVEVLLVRRVPDVPGQRWEALARPMRSLAMGQDIELSPHLRASVGGRTEDDSRILLDVSVSGTAKRFDQVLEEEGSMPIPPYIRQGLADDDDRGAYQTVFAETPGSVAAPTAGLHFTDELIEQIRSRGVEVVYVTHHVGPASFLPVRELADSDADIPWREHKMLSEQTNVPLDTVFAIRRAKAAGKTVTAVGTTAVRALESAARGGTGELRTTNGYVDTDLFITPGYSFAVIDRLLTNFHQPRTTHLLLVAAFAGEDKIAAMYQHALAHDYRFLSYGDAMLLEHTTN